MRKKWQYCNENQEEEILNLENNLKLNRIISTILVSRGVTVDNAEMFLNPTRHDFHNPFEMPDMEKATNRIIEAINKSFIGGILYNNNLLLKIIF